MSLTRRDLPMLISALAAAGADAQEKPAKDVLPAKVYKYEDLPVKQNGQNQSRAVFDGLTHTNYPVEFHMTQLGPGQIPHAPHTHVNEEVIMLRRGLLDMTVNGETTRMTPGSLVYVSSNVLHGSKNPGPEPAEYFVIALGPKA
jgi:mannose-6-phosphate isomerase-like protein (cupin superfamily)